MVEKSEDKLALNFVLNVLRQHEIVLDRLISELEPLVDKVEKLTNKMQCIASQS